MAITFERYQRTMERAAQAREKTKSETPVNHEYRLSVPGAIESVPYNGSERGLEKLLSRACLREEGREYHNDHILVKCADKFHVYA